MKFIFIAFIKWWRKKQSPKYSWTNCCKFTPSCSKYALEAFEKYNFFKAFYLSIYRFFKCNPWSKGGYDPLK